MAHADGIYTYLFQIVQTTLPYFRRYYGTEYTGIMMQTYTFDFHPVVIERKPFIGVKLQCTEPYFSLTSINTFSIAEQFCF